MMCEAVVAAKYVYPSTCIVRHTVATVLSALPGMADEIFAPESVLASYKIDIDWLPNRLAKAAHAAPLKP
jgi:hypothetical protein